MQACAVPAGQAWPPRASSFNANRIAHLLLVLPVHGRSRVKQLRSRSRVSELSCLPECLSHFVCAHGRGSHGLRCAALAPGLAGLGVLRCSARLESGSAVSDKERALHNSLPCRSRRRAPPPLHGQAVEAEVEAEVKVEVEVEALPLRAAREAGAAKAELPRGRHAKRTPSPQPRVVAATCMGPPRVRGRPGAQREP